MLVNGTHQRSDGVRHSLEWQVEPTTYRTHRDIHWAYREYDTSLFSYHLVHYLTSAKVALNAPALAQDNGWRAVSSVRRRSTRWPRRADGRSNATKDHFAERHHNNRRLHYRLGNIHQPGKRLERRRQRRLDNGGLDAMRRVFSYWRVLLRRAGFNDSKKVSHAC